MNIFIYDVYLDKYKKTVRNIEESLNKLNLQGKIRTLILIFFFIPNNPAFNGA